MTELQLTAATAADRARVIQTVVAAFAADPAFRYFFPDEATYATHTATFAGHLFDRRVVNASVWQVGEAAAVALWDPPAPSSSTVDELALPADVLARLDAYEDAARMLLPTTPHWYLGILATHPDFTGRRFGRALLAAGVGRARAEGVPAYLETTNPANVELYQRAGFRVTGRTEAGGLSIWVLAAE